jgi:hypothetical protein
MPLQGAEPCAFAMTARERSRVKWHCTVQEYLAKARKWWKDDLMYYTEEPNTTHP